MNELWMNYEWNMNELWMSYECKQIPSNTLQDEKLAEKALFYVFKNTFPASLFLQT